jgi:L-aminopeptidase/D-esterase-like protein
MLRSSAVLSHTPCDPPISAAVARWDRGTALIPGASTTIGAVVTDAELTGEQSNRSSPSRTLYDGDTLFCLATGSVPAANAVEAVAADVVVRSRPAFAPPSS